MPAETHQRHVQVSAEATLGVLIGGADAGNCHAGDVGLVDSGLDDDVAVLDLWGTVVEEFRERSAGERDIDATCDARALGALAIALHDARDRRGSSHGPAAITKLPES